VRWRKSTEQPRVLHRDGAWSANVVASPICLSVNGSIERREETDHTITTPSRSKGTP